jgi:hypothetical protein
LTYKNFYIRNKLFLSIPINVSIKTIFIFVNCIPSFTFKKKVYKVYLLLALVTYKLFSLFKEADNLNSNNIHSHITSFLSSQDLILNYMIIWSLVEERNRAYIHFIDSSNQKQFFGKFSFKKSDFKLIINEKNYLQEFDEDRTKITFYKVPKLVFFDLNEDYIFLVLTTIPQDFSLYHPSNNKLPKKVLNNIQKNISSCNLSSVLNKKWWIDFSSLKNKPESLYKYIMKHSDNEQIILTSVHGDFGSENIFHNNNEFFIIDWERYSSCAPILVDQIAFWMGKHHKQIKANPKFMSLSLKKEYESFKKIEFLLAIAFLVSVNFNLAVLISSNLISENESII